MDKIFKTRAFKNLIKIVVRLHETYCAPFEYISFRIKRKGFITDKINVYKITIEPIDDDLIRTVIKKRLDDSDNSGKQSG